MILWFAIANREDEKLGWRCSYFRGLEFPNELKLIPSLLLSVANEEICLIAMPTAPGLFGLSLSSMSPPMKKKDVKICVVPLPLVEIKSRNEDMDLFNHSQEHLPLLLRQHHIFRDLTNSR
jgi:hypothetical protein